MCLEGDAVKTLIQVVILGIIGHFVMLGVADFIMAWQLDWDVMTWEAETRLSYVCAQVFFILTAWAGINP